MVEEHQLSERRACSLVGLSRDSYRNPPQPDQLTRDLGERIVDIAHVRRRFGYKRTHDLLRQEFAGHIQIDQVLNSTSYFARPFASWERGSNENFNGLPRQYVPKKRSLNMVYEEEITMIQNRLNNRPSKRIGFNTPAVEFYQSLKRFALRT